MIKDTSGPAFPTAPDIGVLTGDTGMTLRDYFAAKAMQGMFATGLGGELEEFATLAYRAADAMMKAREV
jgi:hypothetical protein